MLDRLLSKPARRPASLSVVIAGGLLAVGVEAARILFRNLTLFRPSRNPISSWNPADYGLDPSSVSEVTFESADGEMLHAWYCRTADPVASLLYCHGNTGNLTNSAPAIPALLAAGLNVFSFDYRGYGRSTGIPTISGLIEDSIAAAEEHEKLRPKALPSILFGYSLGGAVALQLSHRWRFDGLVLQSTFTNLRELARHRFPGTPVQYVVGDGFNSLDAIRSVELPTVIVHGTDDSTVPSWMGQRLFEASRQGRELVLIDGGAHTNLFAIDSARVVDSIRRLALRIRSGVESEARAKAIPARASYPLRKGFMRLIRAIRRRPQGSGTQGSPIAQT